MAFSLGFLYNFFAMRPFFTLTWIVVLSGLTLSDTTRAEDSGATYIKVGAAKVRRTTVLFPAMTSLQGTADTTGLGETMSKTVKADLTFMDQFSFAPEGVQAAIDIELSGKVETVGSTLKLHGRIVDAVKKAEILSRIYVGERDDAKTLAHTFANDIVEKVTGLQGLFLSKIAMVCDGSGKKELYLMNFDGSDTRQITHHRSIVAGPAWSPDGTKIAYSLFTWHKARIKNQDLYELDLKSNRLRLLSNLQGINSGAAYSPDGRTVALTMSFKGNPDIYMMDVNTRTVTQLTHSMGFDVDPSWSPDSRSLAFVSSRSGKPMVFKLNVGNPDKAERLTFAGTYNASPSWSPTGHKILFAAWLQDETHFDIFLINPDGSRLERLTKNQGNNEDPSFSPDGNFILFTSNRTGSNNIYAMNSDGTFVKRLTYGLGNCAQAKWSAPPRKPTPQPATP